MKLNSISLISIALLFGIAGNFHTMFLIPAAVMFALGGITLADELDAHADKPRLPRQSHARGPGES